MGLDSVELVMTIEERFGISIPDADVEKVLTVGEMHQYVVNALESKGRLAGAPSQVCVSQVVFYKIRGAVLSVLAGNRSEFRPSADVAALLGSRRQLQTNWEALEEAVGAEFPQLCLSKPAKLAWGGVGLLAACAFAIFFYAPYPEGVQQAEGGNGWAGSLFRVRAVATAGLFGALGAGLVLIVGHAILSPFRWELPQARYTVRDLVNGVIQRNPELIHGWGGAEWTPEEIWRVLQGIVAEQLRVPLEKVRPEAHFVRDLGVN